MARHSTSSHSIADLVRASGIEASIHGDASREVTGLSQDSRDISEGDLFCCVRGNRYDGHAFISAALEAGAAAVLVEARDPALPDHVVQVEVPDVREAMGHVAAAAFDFPGAELQMVGITGTNGKTTTAEFLRSILESSGRKTAVIGTLSGAFTTPEAIDLQSILRQHRDAGVQSVVMEVSSHALVQSRVNGVMFDAVVFTNLGHDHLDFHGTQDAYFAAKARLFDPSRARHGVVNVDDHYGRQLNDAGVIPTTPFSVHDAADAIIELQRVSFRWRGSMIMLPMGGEYSVINAIAASTTADVLGVSLSDIQRGCAAVHKVPGRFESVPGATDVNVIVDFAHTPEGLEGLLQSVRALGQGRLIVVFGCGGNRDSAKRPAMGAIAGRLADVVVITSDNPRMEDPEAIMSAIVDGMSDPIGTVRTIVNRAEAIESAIHEARHGDIVVIAGKGHEMTQDINGTLLPFSDVETAAVALRNRKGG